LHTCDYVNPKVKREEQELKVNKYSSWMALFKHQKTCPRIPLDCPDCGAKFDKGDEMKQHLRKDCKEVKISCSDCSEEFLRKNFFTKHKCPDTYKQWRVAVSSQDSEITKL
jgi:hypothetical protein